MSSSEPKGYTEPDSLEEHREDVRREDAQRDRLTTRVFSAADVRGLLTPLLGAYARQRGTELSEAQLTEAADDAMASVKSELTEEVIARSAVVRLLEEATAGLWEPNSEDVVELDGEAFLDARLPRLAPAEPVITRSHADRLVALALIWGAHDYDGLPQAVWDELHERGFLSSAGDQSGESWAVVTSEGERFLRAELERGRG